MEVLPDRRKIDPLALVSGEPAMVAAQAKAMDAGGTGSSLFPVFLHLRTGDRSLPEKIAGLRGNATQVHSRLYSGAIPRDAARYISRWPDIAYIEAGRRARPLLDLSVPAVSADIVHQPSQSFPPPFNADGITGAGVYVGVVDSGLSGAHPDFRTGGEGSPLRVSHTYVSPQLPASLSDPLADEDGHGTHVTGIAAGNGFSSEGTYTGMAPEADILFGKTSFFTTDIFNAVSDLLTFADDNDTPVAVSLSLGTVLGPHDGTSGFESAIGSLAAGPAGSRRIIAVSAGNEQDKEEHFQATVPPFGLTTATVTFAGLSSTSVEIWADGDDLYTVTATMGSETVSVPAGSSGTSAGRRISVFVTDLDSRPPNGATSIDLFFLPVSSGGTASIQLRRTRNGGTGKLDGYIDALEGTFDTSLPTGTVTEPANADGVLAVGSFYTKTFTGNPASQGISSFSSLGPTRDGRIKPDLTAPGSVIYSARSFEADFEPIEIVPSPDNNYVILQGTSMSSPHVAGIAALVWESNPDLTGAQMRERLRRTASAPTDGSPVPNTTWGYGKVNALTAVTASVASITAPKTATPDSPVALSSENSSGPFGASITSYQWAAPGASVSSPNNASATFQANAPGDYTVSLTITAGGVTSLPASKIIHVNTVPTAAITGPASAEAGTPVTFSGAGSSDPDVGQTVTFRWVLVARPEGSLATLLPSGADNASMTPDVAGAYEVGLRADDGLDSSPLATKQFTATPPPNPPSSGGGGCSIGYGSGGESVGSSLVTLVLFLSPLAVLLRRARRLRFPYPKKRSDP
jgi:subtilisin family serine protease